MIEDQEVNEWYAKHHKKMMDEGKYYNPCEGCGGEDCQCCDYGRGY